MRRLFGYPARIAGCFLAAQTKQKSSERRTAERSRTTVADRDAAAAAAAEALNFSSHLVSAKNESVRHRQLTANCEEATERRGLTELGSFRSGSFT